MRLPAQPQDKGVVMDRAIVNSTCVLFLFLSLAFSPYVSADTINTKDGKKLKGVVVEEYKDRFVLSTVDGEIAVMKSNVKDLHLDEAEGNLVMLAEKARDSQDYDKSIANYEKALSINPDSRMAMDGLAFVRIQALKKPELNKRADITMKEDFDKYRPYHAEAKAKSSKSAEVKQQPKSLMGMSLKIADYYPEVEDVTKDSPAFAAGVRKGDRIVAIWGRLTRYLSLDEMADILTGKGSGEVKCVIERTVDVPIVRERGGSSSYDLIGLTLAMRFDGLTIAAVRKDSFAERAGLAKDDLVVAIDGSSTRYMPLNKALSMIRSARKNSSLAVTFRINVVIWKEAVR